MNIFIDTQDMEERYGEELYKEYLEKENKQLKEDKKKAIEFIKNAQYDDELKNNVYGLTYSGVQKLLAILGDKDENNRYIK